MSNFHQILCPVDLSENSYTAIELATSLAKQHEAKVAFLYVSPLWLPDDSILIREHSQYSKDIIEDEKRRFNKLRPTDSSVGYEHHYLNGNAGPTVVQATKTADFVVLSTHGRSGMMRFLMGSVAHYVLRNSKCPVILVKGVAIKQEELVDAKSIKQKSTFVTEVMHQVSQVHAFDAMDSVLADLNKARETAAPVVDGSGKCIGILTTTDIENFHSLQERFAAKDETVIDEMFEVDEYGQRRASNCNFDKVERHMTKPVISILDSGTIQQAVELFETNPNINHLVVLDEDRHPVGIVDALNVAGIEFLDSSGQSEKERASDSTP